jgi:hypothetical protein
MPSSVPVSSLNLGCSWVVCAASCFGAVLLTEEKEIV